MTARGEDECRPLARELVCGRAADAARRSGEHDDLTAEPFRHASLVRGRAWRSPERRVERLREFWETVTEALRAARLNATDDVVARWAVECTVRAFNPFGAPVEGPGSYSTGSGARPVPPSGATTAGWRPWHWRGRPRRRRGNRLPDEG